jgi:hypothetical protein
MFLVASSKFHVAEMICDLRLEARNMTLPRERGFTGVEEAAGARRRRSTTDRPIVPGASRH